MGLVKCVRHAEKKKEREMPVQKNPNLSTHSIPALNLFPISGNLWEPGLWSLILFSSVPPNTPLICITLSIPLAGAFVWFSFDLAFKIQNLFKVFLVGFTLLPWSPIYVLDLELQIKSVWFRGEWKSKIPWHHLLWFCRFKMLTRVF